MATEPYGGGPWHCRREVVAVAVAALTACVPFLLMIIVTVPYERTLLAVLGHCLSVQYKDGLEPFEKGSLDALFSFSMHAQI